MTRPPHCRCWRTCRRPCSGRRRENPSLSCPPPSGHPVTTAGPWSPQRWRRLPSWQASCRPSTRTPRFPRKTWMAGTTLGSSPRAKRPTGHDERSDVGHDGAAYCANEPCNKDGGIRYAIPPKVLLAITGRALREPETLIGGGRRRQEPEWRRVDKSVGDLSGENLAIGDGELPNRRARLEVELAERHPESVGAGGGVEVVD